MTFARLYLMHSVGECDSESKPGAAVPIRGLSAYIIAFNEADRIAAAITSLKGLAEEIIVVDGLSTDATCDVAAKLGATVIKSPWKGYGPQKRLGEESCRGEWVLNLDADEYIPPELVEEIRSAFEGIGPKFKAYSLRLAEQYPGEAEPRRFAHAITAVRLYRKDAGRFANDPVFDRVVLNPGVETGTFQNWVHHRSIRSLSHQIAKQNAYTDMQVAAMARSGRTVATIRLLYEGPSAFLKAYILRRQFLRGTYGFLLASTYAMMRHMRIAKALERQYLSKAAHQKCQSGQGRRDPSPTP